MKKKLNMLLTAVLMLGGALATAQAQIQPLNVPRTLVVTMTNDATTNQIIVVDAASHARLQTLSTKGKGGVSGNARGVNQFANALFAAVNHGSGTVAIFRRIGDQLVFEQLVPTTSAPVSVDFSADHMYVAGSNTVDSFRLFADHIGPLDGTTTLSLAGGGVPPEGSTAQVGVAGGNVLVTIKTDPIPGTVDVVALNGGAITGTPQAVSAPAGSLTPFGFSVYPDGSAFITLAHSGQDGLFRNGSFTDVVISGGQAGPCWTTRVDKYVFIVNAGSATVTRVLSTGSNIFIDSVVAGMIPTGGPADTDSHGGYLGVVDHSAGAAPTSHITLFTYNAFGELTPSGNAIDLATPAANGVAIMSFLN